jgi:transcriptional regulator with XRE-family HTH domain
LASELLGLRTRANLNREEIAEQTGINPATLYKIEKAQARPQPRTLKALLDLYHVDEEKREALTKLLRDAGQQTWLQPYNEELSAEYNTLMSFEAEASSFWTYQQGIIPGLLQTEAHARAVIRGMAPAATTEEVERRVTTRMQRQGVLDHLSLWAILDEAALRRQVGTPEEMREQITHLREANQRPGVTLQFHPFDAGPHPALLGSFVLLKFGEPELTDIVYIEGLTSDLFLDDEASVARYADTFEHLRAGAERPASTDAFLAELARRL